VTGLIARLEVLADGRTAWWPPERPAGCSDQLH
jgi:hypothetical protein